MPGDRFRLVPRKVDAELFLQVVETEGAFQHEALLPGGHESRGFLLVEFVLDGAEQFLDRVLARLTFPGALYLAAVAAMPTILINQTSANFFFGGTSILIVIGVALDTMKQLEAQLMMRDYEGFLK